MDDTNGGTGGTDETNNEGGGDGGGDGGGGEAPVFANPDGTLNMDALGEDVRGMLSAKKIDSVQGVLDGYKNLESRLGRDQVAAPKAGAFGDFLNENRALTGAPETLDGYTYEPPGELPEGMEWDEAALKQAQEFAHKQALPPDIFKEMMDFGVQQRVEMFKAIHGAIDADETQSREALKTELGDKYDSFVEGAQMAAKELELPGEVIDKLAKDLTSVETVKFLGKIGNMMSEGSLEGGGGDGGMTGAEEAKAEIETLKTDKAFQDAFHNKKDPGHKAAVDRMKRLHAAVHGEKS